MAFADRQPVQKAFGLHSFVQSLQVDLVLTYAHNFECAALFEADCLSWRAAPEVLAVN